MAYNPMKDLKEFHDKFDRDGKGRQQRPISVSLFDKRKALIAEEFNEVMEAMEDFTTFVNTTLHDNNILDAREPFFHIAKELADLLYVVYGTAEELGIPLQEVFTEVHKSNMSKVWPDGTVHYNQIGKVLKPDTYSPPDLGHLFNERNF